LNNAVQTTPSLRTKLQWGGTLALVIGYAALSHYSYSQEARGLGAALSLTPVILVGIILLGRWTRPLIALLAAALLGAVLYRYWSVVEKNYSWSDFLQQSGLYGLVAIAFVRSLFGDRVPLCTQLAGQLHGALAPVEINYMHRATLAWAAFYILLTTTIVILYFVAPLRIWSLFVNFAALGLIVFAAIVDFSIRYMVLPRRPGDGIVAIIRRALTG
jgi:uncharacterized membrane protein